MRFGYFIKIIFNILVVPFHCLCTYLWFYCGMFFCAKQVIYIYIPIYYIYIHIPTYHIFHNLDSLLPVVPHKAVAEVSRRGNL